MAWRFLLQDAVSGEWIDLDVPLSDVSITKAINSPGGISGNIPFEYATLRKSNDQLALREWGTLLHAEEDGVIVQSAIIDQISLEGESLQIDAGGWSMLANEIPWMGATKNYLQVDPLDVFRDIWQHVQSYPNSDLGILVDPLKSKVRIGTPEDPKLTAAKAKESTALKLVTAIQNKINTVNTQIDTQRKAIFSAAKYKAAGQIFVSNSAPTGAKRNKSNIWIDADAANKPYKFTGTEWAAISLTTAQMNALMTLISTYNERVKELGFQKTELTKAKAGLAAYTEDRKTAAETGEAVPYTLSWYETEDVQTVIDDLVAVTPFQYHEDSLWVGDNVRYQLKLGQPTIGTRRENVRFEVGVNVVEVPTISISDYASEALVFGAGEGSKKVRSIVTVYSDRLRRVKVTTEKDMTSKDRTSAAARALLKENNGSRNIDTLTVVDHPLAPYGTYDVGDEVRVVGDMGWQRDFDQWVRILDMTITPDTNQISMKVEVA